MDLARLIGTDEPRYADPDAALVSRADEWRARIDPARLRTLVESLPAPRSRLHAPEAMDQTDALLAAAWREAGWRVGHQRLHLRGARGILDYPGTGGGLQFHTY